MVQSVKRRPFGASTRRRGASTTRIFLGWIALVAGIACLLVSVVNGPLSFSLDNPVRDISSTVAIVAIGAVTFLFGWPHKWYLFGGIITFMLGILSTLAVIYFYYFQV